MLCFLSARKQSKLFFSQPKQNRDIVFYAEDDFSFIHFKELINILTGTYKKKVSYLTSQIDDPVLNLENENFSSFYIGKGFIRTSTFFRMDAELFIMTMPDLETFHLKRSKVWDVHYVYVFHAMVSAHSNYRTGAFDHYDTIFLSSPYQESEIRKTEEYYNLTPKKLVKYGYPQLESLITEVQQWRAVNSEYDIEQKQARVIVAPSWSEYGILETIGISLVGILLDAGFNVTVRPHPHTTNHRPDIISKLENNYSSFTDFELQTDTRDKASLYRADLMISDWSGIGMEYAFSCERPVIYIDVPKKCLNPDAEKILGKSVEESIRKQIGIIVSPDELDRLPDIINECFRDKKMYTDNAIKLREKYVFNLGSSTATGAEYLHDLVDTRLSSR